MVRRRARVLGPGEVTGEVLLDCGVFSLVVTESALPATHRLPNFEFVVVTVGRKFLRVEPDGTRWLTRQHEVRTILNRDWDPIGVSEYVDDEYDGYIADIHHLCVQAGEATVIADYLEWVEEKRMGLGERPRAALESVATKLLALSCH
jgi:hypothetical protein